MDTSIYRINFENGDKAEIEATSPQHAEIVACQMTGHRAAAHCEVIRRGFTTTETARPVAKFIPRS